MKHTYNILRRSARAAALAALVALAPAACTDDTDAPGKPGAQTPDGQGRVDIPIALISTPAMSYTVDEQGETRAVMDSHADTKYKNIWVLEYDGTGDDAPLELKWYKELADAKQPSADGTLTDDDLQPFKLTAGPDKTIVVLANTFDATIDWVVKAPTLADLKALRWAVTDQHSLFRKQAGDTDEGFPATGGWYPLCAGVFQGTLTAGDPTPVNVHMYYAFAKVTFTVNNSSADVDVVRAWLTKVPKEMPYVNPWLFGARNASYNPALTGSTGNWTAGTPTFEDEDIAGNVTTPATWLDEYGATGDADKVTANLLTGTGTQSVTWYVPASHRPIVSGIANEQENWTKRPGKQIELMVETAEKDPIDATLKRRYYWHLFPNTAPGHYTLVGHRHYEVGFNITRTQSKNDARRVYVSGGVTDWTKPNLERASTYMFCPPVHDQTRAVLRIPVDNYRTFWSDPDLSTHSEYANAELSSCHVQIQWVQGDAVTQASWPSGGWPTTLTGLSVAIEDDHIKAEITDQTPEANVLFSLIDDLGRCLWSWHLWITRYVPYCATYVDAEHTNVVRVPHGFVTKAQSGQTSLALKIMDRPCGMLNTLCNVALFQQTSPIAYPVRIDNHTWVQGLTDSETLVLNPMKRHGANYNMHNLYKKYNYAIMTSKNVLKAGPPSFKLPPANNSVKWIIRATSAAGNNYYTEDNIFPTNPMKWYIQHIDRGTGDSSGNKNRGMRTVDDNDDYVYHRYNEGSQHWEFRGAVQGGGYYASFGYGSANGSDISACYGWEKSIRANVGQASFEIFLPYCPAALPLKMDW